MPHDPFHLPSSSEASQLQQKSDALDHNLKIRGLSPERLSDPQYFGRLFFDNLYRILKIGSIYEVEHNQTRLAVEEFFTFFEEAMRLGQDDSFAIMVRDELAIVNGVTLRLDRQAQKRHNEMRDLFTDAEIRGVELKRGLRAEEFIRFLIALKRASLERGGMEHVALEHLELSHGAPIRSIIEAVSQVNHAMYVTHIYIRGLVKVTNMHAQVKERQSAEIPVGVVKRILQTISELLSDEDFTILGLLPLRLLPPSLATHSFNTAIYGMLMADRMGLEIRTTSHIGMAILYQDLDRLVGVAVAHRDRETQLGAHHQFNSNLRDVARMLSRVQGDVISTLRVLLTYERGCPFNAPVSRPFYRGARELHLITRIIDLCRTYDLLIQGLEGYKARRPDLAIQYIESRAGDAFDPALVNLFISTMGIYPIGANVELTSGERALVIRTPSPSADPRRPVVKLIDGAQAVLDLSDARYGHIEIARTLPTEEQDFSSSRLFLLT